MAGRDTQGIPRADRNDQPVIRRMGLIAELAVATDHSHRPPTG